MRRVVFLVLGFLECVVAVVLASFGWQLPGDAEIQRGFQSADRVTHNAGDQVRIVRRQVQDVRRSELSELAKHLQTQTVSVTSALKNDPVDFETVQSMRDALGEIGDSLDGLAKSLDAAAAKDKAAPVQPEFRATLARSATVLKTSSNQLSRALQHRNRYEETLSQSVAVAETLAGTLPFLTEQLDHRLAEEEHALNELENSLTEARAALPIYAQTTTHVLRAGRLLAWLGATIAALHGCYLMLSARMGRRFSL
jgi:hypothetical protein